MNKAMLMLLGAAALPLAVFAQTTGATTPPTETTGNTTADNLAANTTTADNATEATSNAMAPDNATTDSSVKKQKKKPMGATE